MFFTAAKVVIILLVCASVDKWTNENIWRGEDSVFVCLMLIILK